LAKTYNPQLERDILKNIRQISDALFDFDNMIAEIEAIHKILQASNQSIGA